jgi:nicotinate phosphoribosyltransferase
MTGASNTAPAGEQFALLADLYELTMMQAYETEGMTAPAVFDLYVRTLPPSRNFLLACGLSELLDYLETLRFTPEALASLASLDLFTPDFLARLARFRFTGSVWAVPEGTPVFANEPLIEVIAPLPEAQLVETYLLNQVTFQTAIASKAARSVLAAGGRPVVDFGQRRAHGSDAGVKAARATYLAGCASTSSLLAGQRYGIPVTGTMAHAYVQSHASEAEAFRAFAQRYPGTTLLVDTYDTIEGVRMAIETVRALGGVNVIRAVRLDSGDLDVLSRETRALLDAAGLHDVGIVVSGGIEERKIASLVAAGAPITAYAVGTSVVVPSDGPTLDSVYKLVEYAGVGRAKFSTAKATLPGRKQVYREFDGDPSGDNTAVRDHLVGHDEAAPGRPLLVEVMRDGRRLPLDLSLEAARERARTSIAALPSRLRSLEPADPPYEVVTSPTLLDARERLRPASHN